MQVPVYLFSLLTPLFCSDPNVAIAISAADRNPEISISKNVINISKI